MTRPQSFQTLPREAVVEQVEQFLVSFELADESPAVTQRLLELLAELPIGGKQVHDANIVATMMAYGIPSLLTDNTKDFERYGRRIRVVSIH